MKQRALAVLAFITVLLLRAGPALADVAFYPNPNNPHDRPEPNNRYGPQPMGFTGYLVITGLSGGIALILRAVILSGRLKGLEQGSEAYKSTRASATLCALWGVFVLLLPFIEMGLAQLSSPRAP